MYANARMHSRLMLSLSLSPPRHMNEVSPSNRSVAFDFRQKELDVYGKWIKCYWNEEMRGAKNAETRRWRWKTKRDSFCTGKNTLCIRTMSGRCGMISAENVIIRADASCSSHFFSSVGLARVANSMSVTITWPRGSDTAWHPCGEVAPAAHTHPCTRHWQATASSRRCSRYSRPTYRRPFVVQGEMAGTTTRILLSAISLLLHSYYYLIYLFSYVALGLPAASHANKNESMATTWCWRLRCCRVLSI